MRDLPPSVGESSVRFGPGNRNDPLPPALVDASPALGFAFAQVSLAPQRPLPFKAPFDEEKFLRKYFRQAVTALGSYEGEATGIIDNLSNQLSERLDEERHSLPVPPIDLDALPGQAKPGAKSDDHSSAYMPFSVSTSQLGSQSSQAVALVPSPTHTAPCATKALPPFTSGRASMREKRSLIFGNERSRASLTRLDEVSNEESGSPLPSSIAQRVPKEEAVRLQAETAIRDLKPDSAHAFGDAKHDEEDLRQIIESLEEHRKSATSENPLQQWISFNVKAQSGKTAEEGRRTAAFPDSISFIKKVRTSFIGGLRASRATITAKARHHNFQSTHRISVQLSQPEPHHPSVTGVSESSVAPWDKTARHEAGAPPPFFLSFSAPCGSGPLLSQGQLGEGGSPDVKGGGGMPPHAILEPKRDSVDGMLPHRQVLEMVRSKSVVSASSESSVREGSVSLSNAEKSGEQADLSQSLYVIEEPASGPGKEPVAEVLTHFHRRESSVGASNALSSAREEDEPPHVAKPTLTKEQRFFAARISELEQQRQQQLEKISRLTALKADLHSQLCQTDQAISESEVSPRALMRPLDFWLQRKTVLSAELIASVAEESSRPYAPKVT